MEFGNTIPLYYLMMCVVFATPVVGLILLAAIRFGIKDIRLAKNIFYTVVGGGIVAFLSPIFFVFKVLSLVPMDCLCAPTFQAILSDIAAIDLSIVVSGARWVPIGIDAGFVVAFFIVLPVTLIVRRFRKS